MSHEVEIRRVNKEDEHEVACSCGFKSSATNEVYAKAVRRRHLDLNNIHTA
jgi:hypothetical protein